MDRATKLAFGAYYTDDDTAQLLADWALRLASDTACDPSFGGGAFLRRCIERVAQLGGHPQIQVYGVEIDELAFKRTKDALGAIPIVVPHGLRRANFFEVCPSEFGPFDAVVGNPPYIRYHRFAGEGRQSALAAAREAGVDVPQLASAWAPFLVHAVRFVKPGGRLAMVLPAEVLYATYSLPVLKFLHSEFGRLDVFTFAESQLFPDLEQGAVVLLADERGRGPAKSFLHVLRTPTELGGAIQSLGTNGIEIDLADVAEKRTRVAEYLLERSTRDLYHDILNDKRVRQLSTLIDVDIGYVTGASDFFHLSAETVRSANIPKNWRWPVLRRGRSVKGLRFTLDDWNGILTAGATAYLLAPPRNFRRVPAVVDAYHKTEAGKAASQTFKCRERDPWWKVPISYIPDGFLIYGCGDGARIVINSVGLAASNAVHVIKRNQEEVGLTEVATSWLSTLSRLSVEIEGHHMGGGMLKLDPTAAERTKLVIACSQPDADSLCEAVDDLLRGGCNSEARQLVDDFYLNKTLGLSRKQIGELSYGVHRLQRRAMKGTRRKPTTG